VFPPEPQHPNLSNSKIDTQVSSNEPQTSANEEQAVKSALAFNAALAGDSRVRKTTVHLVQIAVLVIVVGLWQYLASRSETLFLAIGTPWSVKNHGVIVPGVAQWLASWATNGPVPHGQGWPDLFVTLKEATYGYFLGVSTGILLGASLGSSLLIRKFAAPFIAIANAFPKIALAPMFILIFGSSLSMKAYFVAAGTFFITFYAVFGGIRTVDPVYLRSGKILGASRVWLIREIYIPSIFGWVVSGLRLTAAWALTSAVIVEFLAANSGMGYVVNFGQQSGDLAQCWGGLFIISLVALIVDRSLYHLSKHFSAWRLK
jgi:NitT/TauT family transport system permease protein